MNARLVAALDSALEACLLALAFILPLAVHLKAYDPFSLKAGLLSAASALAVGLWLARAIESGRLEIPAPRAGLAGLGAAFLAWSVLRSGNDGIVRAAGPALFLIVLLGPGAAGFSRSLCWALLSSAALSAAYALAGRLGFNPLPWAPAGSTLGSMSLLGATLLAALPLALPLALDPESPMLRRLLAAGLGTVCLFGLLEGVLSLDSSLLADAVPHKAGVMATLVGSVAEHPWLGVGTGEIPMRLLWGRPEAAAALLPIPISEPLSTAAELGVPAAALWSFLLLSSLSLGFFDALRRNAAGDKRTAALALAQAASIALLVAAGLVTGASYAPAPGLWLWLLAGAAAAMALENGAAVVRAMAVPLPPSLRRLLLAPLAAGVAAMFVAPAARLSGQFQLNRGVGHEEAGETERALELYRAIRPDSAAGLQARLRGTRLLLDEEGTPAAEAARGMISQVLAVDPRFGDAMFLRAQSDRRRQSWAEAAKGYELYAFLNPTDARTYKPLAEMKQTLGDRRGAVDAAQMLVALSPDDPEAWRFYAEQLHTIDPAAAVAAYRRAAQVKDLATTRKDTQLIP